MYAAPNSAFAQLMRLIYSIGHRRRGERTAKLITLNVQSPFALVVKISLAASFLYGVLVVKEKGRVRGTMIGSFASGCASRGEARRSGLCNNGTAEHSTDIEKAESLYWRVEDSVYVERQTDHD
jgi:hypothetical protein